jgi:hypothetical protein
MTSRAVIAGVTGLIGSNAISPGRTETEHALVPEPFLLVGLISAIRRVLVLTAEFEQFRTEIGAQQFVIELAVLTLLIVALVASLIFLRKSGASIATHRA